MKNISNITVDFINRLEIGTNNIDRHLNYDISELIADPIYDQIVDLIYYISLINESKINPFIPQ